MRNRDQALGGLDAASLRVGVAAEHLWGPWAVLPETLAALAVAFRGVLTGGTLQATAVPEAATRERSSGNYGGVAVIPLHGVITPRGSLLQMLFGGGGGLQGFRESLRDALDDDAITAIVLDVASPGGSTDLVTETAAEIRQARGVKPIVAQANVRAASAAYWLASQADEVVVAPSGEVGSIGVFALHEEFSKMDEMMGVTTTLIRAGKYKAEDSPYIPLSEEARGAIQAMVDEFYDGFVDDVAAGRGVASATVRRGFGEGRMLTARRAVTEGMADSVATIEQTIVRLARSNGSRSARADALAAGGVTLQVALDPAALSGAIDRASGRAEDPAEPKAAEQADDTAPGGGADQEESAALADVLFA